MNLDNLAKNSLSWKHVGTCMFKRHATKRKQWNIFEWRFIIDELNRNNLKIKLNPLQLKNIFLQMQEGLIYSPYSGKPQFIGQINLGINGAVQQTKYNRKVALGLGITQMINGISCLIMNSVLISPNPFINLIACGIWGGMLVSNLIHISNMLYHYTVNI